MKFSLLLPLVSLLASCAPEQKNSSLIAPDTPETSLVKSDTASDAADTTVGLSAEQMVSPLPTSGAPAKSTYQLLQGKWQSTDDARSVIELKGHAYIDYYGGEPLDTAEFVLAQACPSEAGAGYLGDNERYLVEPKEAMCWEVVGVDEESLELSYTARGNSLNYRKIK
ncbi:hypothetical protein [uncultured Hymenobacter sp.]|uniref:hypothetical protein n=1 Tax=uncultured Hymenobacter sp. TaxID=170016 RepID=UPI0035CA7840